MRVGINARLLASPDQRGFNRYTAELVRALALLDVEVVLFSQGDMHPAHRLEGLGHVTTVARAVVPQWRWQHQWLPSALAEQGIDVFHAPAHWGVPWRSSCPVVTTIHDLADRELPAAFAGAPLRAKLRHRIEERLAVARSARIITVSEYSARSIERFLGVPRARIAVTVEGAAPVFAVPQPAARIAEVAARHGLTAPWFIHVGGFDERKNLGLIVRALAHLPAGQRVTVALVGARGAEAEALARSARAAQVEQWMPQLGVVPDEELVALYAGALAVVEPSRLEGFGLPVVEGMHAGTPAIVSSAGSLPEIAGDAGIVVGPDDAGALADALRSLAGDAGRRALLAERAGSRAPKFTWRAAAEQTLAVYEDARRGVPVR